MSFALPPSMRSYIDERVRGGGYGNASEYLRGLIRRDQQSEAARCFPMLIADGLASGGVVRRRPRSSTICGRGRSAELCDRYPAAPARRGR